MQLGFWNRRAVPALAPFVAEAVGGRVEAPPLSSDNTADMAGNKRDDERLPLEGQVRGEVMVFQPMTILDISAGGAQIETAFPLQLDSLHDFRLSLADRSIIVKGRVAHCHIGELTEVAALYRTGIEFVELSEHARAAISGFVQDTKQAQVSPSVLDGKLAGDPPRS